MDFIKDLDIEKNIIPLFDYTINDFSRKEVFKIFEEPATSMEEAIFRQKIVKAFLRNQNHLRTYSYARVDFYEVYAFSKKLYSKQSILKLSKTDLTLKLTFSKAMRHRCSAPFIQFILLLYHLNNRYFSRFNKQDFPEPFQQTITHIQQLFISLPLSKYENKIRNNRFGVKVIINLIHDINKYNTEEKIKHFWDGLFVFEAWLSITKGMIIRDFVFPEFKEHTFQIKGLYHPGINMPIKNNLNTECNITLITGPNMSGKSTLLKSFALCVYLSRIGLGVPASECTIPFFNYLSVNVNLSDYLAKGESHFLSEINRLKEGWSDLKIGKILFEKAGLNQLLNQ